jgi:hypothetical protein
MVCGWCLAIGFPPATKKRSELFPIKPESGRSSGLGREPGKVQSQKRARGVRLPTTERFPNQSETI